MGAEQKKGSTLDAWSESTHLFHPSPPSPGGMPGIAEVADSITRIRSCRR